MNWVVYHLYREGSTVPFYIGISSRPRNRKNQHRKTYGKCEFRIIRQGLSFADANRLETDEILRWAKQGTRLANQSKNIPGNFLNPCSIEKEIWRERFNMSPVQQELVSRISLLIQSPEIQRLIHTYLE